MHWLGRYAELCDWVHDAKVGAQSQEGLVLNNNIDSDAESSESQKETMKKLKLGMRVMYIEVSVTIIYLYPYYYEVTMVGTMLQLGTVKGNYPI